MRSGRSSHGWSHCEQAAEKVIADGRSTALETMEIPGWQRFDQQIGRRASSEAPRRIEGHGSR
jgi:hypothetical protein